MKFLSSEEKKYLMEILRRIFSDYQTADERKNLLSIYELTDFANSLHLDSTTDKFVIELSVKLSQSYFSWERETKQTLALIIFLVNALDNKSSFLNKEDRKFIQSVIAKYKQWQVSKTTNQQPETIDQDEQNKLSVFFTLYSLFKNSILFLTKAVIDFCRTAPSQWVQMPRRSDIPNESTRPATLSNQNKHIEETKSECTKIREENQELSETWNSSFLYPALLKLGYGKQAILFKTLIKKLSVGSFLIYGEPEYGQRWLLNRLIKQQISQSTTNKVIRIVLNRITQKNDVSALWRELAGRVDLRRKSSPEEIIERIYKWWQTQNVILIIDYVHCLPEMYINKLIYDFWMPLANQAKDANASTSKFKLLLFLVDYGGCIENWNVRFVEQLDASWEPDITIKLPILTKFSDVELMNWLESEDEALPPDLREELDNNTVQFILENTDYGIPEPTLEEICRLCGCNWHEEERKWLTF
ncbi:hypothetical protein [Floridanema evergladense]|uniref:AAA+ ATPase domain-containing protein n=1 Tax=Floridaenema evergladense BLCC-F167 TaxID=3153639 RepID=A0ABV4WRS8_9CYAN